MASPSRSRLGYLKFCALGVKIPVGIPQALWIHGADHGWNTSSFVASRSRSRFGYLKFVVSRSRPRLEYLKFGGYVVKIPVGIPQACGIVVAIPVGIPQVLGRRGPDLSSFVASRSGSRLGYLKFCSFAVRNPFGIHQVCGFAVRIPVGIPQVCVIVVTSPVRTPQVLWLRGQDPGWDTSSVVASQSGSRLAYLKFCGFAVKIPVGIPQVCGFLVRIPMKVRYLKFVVSWSRSRLGYLKCCSFVVKIPVGIPQVCGFVVRIPVGIPQVWWLRGQNFGWDSSSWSRTRLRYLKFCGFVVTIPVEIPQVCGFSVKIPVGIPQVCGLAVKIPIWIPQVLWLRGQDPGYLKFCGFVLRTRSRSWLGYLKFVASWSRVPVGILQVLWLGGQDPSCDTSRFVASWSRSRLGLSRVLWLRSRNPQILWLRGHDPAGLWSRSWLGYLNFCGQDPDWMPQFWWLRGQSFGGNTSSVVPSWSRSRSVCLKLCGFVVKMPVGIPPYSPHSQVRPKGDLAIGTVFGCWACPSANVGPATLAAAVSPFGCLSPVLASSGTGLAVASGGVACDPLGPAGGLAHSSRVKDSRIAC